MLRALADIATENQGMNQATWNAILESTAIHMRNMLDFLCPPPSQKKDDIVATQFVSSWTCTLSSDLEDARCACNKQVAHLTYHRLSNKQEWDTQLVFKVLDLFDKFLAMSGRTCPLAPLLRRVASLPLA